MVPFENSYPTVVGFYKLQTDAAMAFDTAAKVLRGTDCPRVNWKNKQDYMYARAKEMEHCKPESYLLAEVAEKIKKFLLKIPRPPCPELVLKNNEMAKKWSRFLPSETGEEFLELYQNDIAGLARKELDTSAPSLATKYAVQCGVESVQDKNPDAFFIPIGTRSPQLSSQSKSNDSSDDNMSISSNTEEEENADLSKAADISDTGSLDLKSNGIEQDSFKSYPIPIGCPVLWDFKTNSFRRGVVVSPPITSTDGDIAYKVMPAKGSRNESGTVIPKTQLALGIDCPVQVIRNSNETLRPLEGKILFSAPVSVSAECIHGTSFLYTILIVKKRNQFQVMTDVPSPFVRCAPAKETLVPADNNKGPLSGSPKAAYENSQKDCQNLFSPNSSTITSEVDLSFT